MENRTMKRRVRTAAAIILTAVALTPVVGAQGDGQGTTAARCRRVQLTGSIVVTPGPKPDFKGVVNAAHGTFKMDLIFSEKGGEVRYQQNTVELTQIKSHSYGGARPCTNTLPAAASAPMPFTIWARLGVDEVVVEDANQKVKSVADQFDMIMKTQPPSRQVTYSVVCEGGRPGTASDYGTSIAQLLQIFTRTQYSGSVTLNRMGDKRQLPNVSLLGGMTANAEWETLETLVPCANFQYK
jgi:hypothetical protein